MVGDPAEDGAWRWRAPPRDVREWRRQSNDSYNFQLAAADSTRIPDAVRWSTNEKHAIRFELGKDHAGAHLAAICVRAFSGIVAGNVKEAGVKAIEKHGPFEIRGDRAIVSALDTLLTGFVRNGA